MYRYSQRLAWSVPPNFLTELRKSKEAEGRRIVDLTVSNPVATLPSYPYERLRQIFCALGDFSYLPNPLGDLHARKAVANYYAVRGMHVSPEQIALTASTSEAYSVLFKLLCDPGDEVLAPTPSYPLFDYLAGLESVRAVPYRMLYAGNWFLDFDHLADALSDRTRAIIVVNPNNPTGSYLKNAELFSLNQIALERGIPLISDEVFADYPIAAAEDVVTSLAADTNGLGFSLNGLSKTAGMPQLKLGWIVIHGDGEQVAAASERLQHILDTYLSVATPVQRVLPEIMETGLQLQQEIRARISSNYKMLFECLHDSPVHPLQTEGGWSAILQLPCTRSEDDWTRELLDRHDVAVQPGYFFDLASEAFVVVSLLAEPADLAVGLNAMKEITRG